MSDLLEKLLAQDEARLERAVADVANQCSSEASPDEMVARSSRRHKTYGLTPEQFDYLLRSQNYSCALCHRNLNEETACVDHDHETGKVRGLLCSGCNSGLGKLGDTVESLLRAVEYLRRSI